MAKIRDHRVDVGRQHRVGHAERLEDALGEHVAQLLLRHLLDDQAEQQEVGVAVEEAAARIEVEMTVARRGVEEVDRTRRLVEPVPAQPQQFEEVGQAARIAYHLVDGDGQRLELGQVLVRRVGEVELAVGRQHQRRGDGELLADRGDAEACLRCDRHAVLDACQPVALADLDLARAHHGDDGARRTGLGVTGEQRIDAAFEGEGCNRF